MSQTWIASIWRLIGLLAIALLIGLITGYTTTMLILTLSVYIGWHIRQILAFDHWINHQSKEPPALSGIWEDIAYRIFRIQKRSRQRKKRLTKMLRSYQTSTNSFPDASVVIDQNGHIVWFNTSARELLGFKSTDIHSHIGNLVRNSEFAHYLRANRYDEPLEIISPIDENSTLDVRVVPYAGEQRLLLFRNITHIKRLLTVRQDFVANVSHELKTPLTIILGYLENFTDLDPENVDDMQQVIQQMAKVDIAAKRMQAIVDDLLLLSQLDTKQAIPIENCQSVSVMPLIESVINEASELSKNHTISNHITKNIIIYGKEQEIYSIFSNLINNAVRHTPANTHIDIQLELDSDGAHFFIQDNGPGIPPEHVSRLTERFYRADYGRARKQGGTGLGLAIVKHALRRLEGDIEIKSQHNQGSQFICHIPLKRINIHPAEISHKNQSANQEPVHRLH